MTFQNKYACVVFYSILAIQPHLWNHTNKKQKINAQKYNQVISVTL